MSNGDPLERAFELLKSCDQTFVPNTHLEDRLVQELKSTQARRRRLLWAAPLVAVAVLLAAGGVHAAGGFTALEDWLSGVTSADVSLKQDGSGEATVKLKDAAGIQVGTATLKPDKNGNFAARLIDAQPTP